MARARHSLHSGGVEIFRLRVLAVIDLAQIFDSLVIAGADKLPHNLLGDVATDVFPVVRLVLLAFPYFPQQTEPLGHPSNGQGFVDTGVAVISALPGPNQRIKSIMDKKLGFCFVQAVDLLRE